MPDEPSDRRRPDRTEHYFSARPAAPEERRQIEVGLAGRRLPVWTAAGVFSGDHLDLGTAVLLREVPPPQQPGTFLDLGCGWGPLTLALGLSAPSSTIWAVDVNERAVQLTAANAESAGLKDVRACLPDQVPDEVSFDLIWSNPPIRIGKEALHTMLLRWLPRLRPGGLAHLVVQRNLGADSLQAWLTATLGSTYEVRRFASAKGFRVLEVHRLGADDLPDPA